MNKSYLETHILQNTFLLWIIKHISMRSWDGKEPSVRSTRQGNPTENEEISSFTCWWFGKCSMAFRSKWVTSARSRTGMPAARSCLVRLKTHALAANCTGKFRGWFLIPITTSWNAQVLPTLASYTFVHVLQEQSPATWSHNNDSQHPVSASLKQETHLVPFYFSGGALPSAQWFKADNFYFSKSFRAFCNSLKDRLQGMWEIPRKIQSLLYMLG